VSFLTQISAFQEDVWFTSLIEMGWRSAWAYRQHHKSANDKVGNLPKMHYLPLLDFTHVKIHHISPKLGEVTCAVA
jgi:hypothetical protein